MRASRTACGCSPPMAGGSSPSWKSTASTGRSRECGFRLRPRTHPQGYRISQGFLHRLEETVQKAESYRGKILSLEKADDLLGKSSGILVHRLANVGREQVILPASTLELLERNVVRFVDLRAGSTSSGLATKKGLLFYGPPGTGKTHTIHYLAGALKGHTTLLITAEQVGLLGEYMALARLLQPSMVVIEDVDLIARDRTADGQPLRGSSAEQAAQRDGRPAARLGDPLRPDDQPPRGAGGGAGVKAGAGRPGD